jgi:hypothetical protein
MELSNMSDGRDRSGAKKLKAALAGAQTGLAG